MLTAHSPTWKAGDGLPPVPTAHSPTWKAGDGLPRVPAVLGALALVVPPSQQPFSSSSSPPSTPHCHLQRSWIPLHLDDPPAPGYLYACVFCVCVCVRLLFVCMYMCAYALCRCRMVEQCLRTGAALDLIAVSCALLLAPLLLHFLLLLFELLLPL